MSSSQYADHIPGLNGLRGLAALAVFAVHFNQIAALEYAIGPFDLYRFLANGEHGVALFFALSGFLLSIPFWRAIGGESRFPNWKVYALRRSARIVPAYYLLLTLLVCLSHLWRIPGGWTDILLHYTFLFNYTDFTIFSINPPFWTLAVEMQFYCMLPLLFVSLRRLPPLTATGMILLFAFASYAISVWIVDSADRVVPWPWNPWLTWIRPYGAVVSHSLFAHLPHFLLGVMAGRAYLMLNKADTEKKRRFHFPCETIFWLSLAAILILVGTGLEDRVSLPKGRYGLPITPALLTVLVLTTPFTRIAQTMLVGFPLEALGTISYGFYLYHFMCLNVAAGIMGRFGWDAGTRWVLFCVIALSLTIAAATVSYLAIEKPVMKMARRFRRPG